MAPWDAGSTFAEALVRWGGVQGGARICGG